MGNCCTTRDREISLDAYGKDYYYETGQKGFKTEVSKSLLYISQYLDSNRDAQMIVLSYQKNEMKNFLQSLSSIITIIKSKTGQLFIPTVIQNSPININNEMLITLRSIEKMDKISIDREAIIDDSMLARSFITRDMQFLTSEPEKQRDQLLNDLRNMYNQEGLMIVGGVQDPGMVNNLKMLFYKTQNFKNTDQSTYQSYDIKIHVYPDTTTQQEFQIIVNQAQVESNSQLRSVISYEDAKKGRSHFLIFQEYQADLIYLITDYPDYLHEEYQQVLRDAILGAKTPNDLVLKQQYSEKMSTYMNVQEKRSGNRVVECITNNSLADSFIIYAQ
ncbi:UNKNOWN [Stylonychia lemnae]|uniref:Uncharacterized protein n=1 Tax=Stylonychia lemnae TaxID=5949 RepID=A0A078B7F4_STYLE|nr:UNKNOWN [Stylonychia lemnae]|eukprot:CDW90344.1 UNKNOWN [Stylonychia lemnae]